MAINGLYMVAVVSSLVVNVKFEQPMWDILLPNGVWVKYKYIAWHTRTCSCVLSRDSQIHWALIKKNLIGYLLQPIASVIFTVNVPHSHAEGSTACTLPKFMHGSNRLPPTHTHRFETYIFYDVLQYPRSSGFLVMGIFYWRQIRGKKKANCNMNYAYDPWCSFFPIVVVL